jgi:hypothetical protein
MTEKFESIYKFESEPKISKEAKEIIEESKNSSDKEILDLNEELTENFTNFIDLGLRKLKDKINLKDFEDFNKAISKYPLVDLACGMPTNGVNRDLFTILFKDKWHRHREDYNNNSKFKSEIDNIGIAEPKKYIGVDKYTKNKLGENDKELNDKVQFVKEDLVLYLRTLPDNSVNIFLGGFDMNISRPRLKDEVTPEGKYRVLRPEDKYRAILMAEISRVLANGGYCYTIESPLYIEWKNQQVSIKDFGLTEVSLDEFGGNIKLFKKPNIDNKSDK